MRTLSIRMGCAFGLVTAAAFLLFSADASARGGGHGGGHAGGARSGGGSQLRSVERRPVFGSLQRSAINGSVYRG